MIPMTSSLESRTNRFGMTLIELMVVIAILGLLAVTVLPVFNGSPNKALLRNAAATVESHVAQGFSKAIGSRTGYGLWIAQSNTSATLSIENYCTTLAFCSGMSVAQVTATLTVPTSGTSQSIGVSLIPTVSTLFPGSQVPSGTLISFLGLPYEYELQSPSGTSVCMRTSQNQTPFNASWPQVSGTIQLQCGISIPPARIFGRKTLLVGNSCVDLSCSTVGVYAYSPSIDQIGPTSPLIITFDPTGQVKSAMYSILGSSSTMPQQRRIDTRTPIALLVGMRDQVGQAYISPPTDDTPGTNYQRKDAFWVVIDPRTGTAMIIENYPNATDISKAQTFIRQTLLNLNSAQ